MIMFTKLYGVYKVRSKAREQSGSYVLRLLSLVSTNALVSKQRRNYLLIMSLHMIVHTLQKLKHIIYSRRKYQV